MLHNSRGSSTKSQDSDVNNTGNTIEFCYSDAKWIAFTLFTGHSQVDKEQLLKAHRQNQTAVKDVYAFHLYILGLTLSCNLENQYSLRFVTFHLENDCIF